MLWCTVENSRAICVRCKHVFNYVANGSYQEVADLIQITHHNADYHPDWLREQIKREIPSGWQASYFRYIDERQAALKR